MHLLVNELYILFSVFFVICYLNFKGWLFIFDLLAFLTDLAEHLQHIPINMQCHDAWSYSALHDALPSLTIKSPKRFFSFHLASWTEDWIWPSTVNETQITLFQDDISIQNWYIYFVFVTFGRKICEHFFPFPSPCSTVWSSARCVFT